MLRWERRDALDRRVGKRATPSLPPPVGAGLPCGRHDAANRATSANRMPCNLHQGHRYGSSGRRPGRSRTGRRHPCGHRGRSPRACRYLPGHATQTHRGARLGKIVPDLHDPSDQWSRAPRILDADRGPGHARWASCSCLLQRPRAACRACGCSPTRCSSTTAAATATRCGPRCCGSTSTTAAAACAVARSARRRAATAPPRSRPCRVLESLGAVELAQPRRLRGDAGRARRLRASRSTATSTRCARSPRTRCRSCARSAGRSRSIPTIRGRSSAATRRCTPRPMPDRERPDWFGLELGDRGRRPARRICCRRCSSCSTAPAISSALAAVVAALHRGPRRRRSAGCRCRPRGCACSRKVLLELYRDGGKLARAGDPRAADRRAVRDAARRRAPAALGRRHEDPRAGVRARARAAPHRRRVAARRRCAPSCGRTSARAWRGSSTCARTAPAACSPTTWASARRCRRSRTS